MSTREPFGRAIRARAGLLDERHEGAWRLLAGPLEGVPRFVVDVYARTLVVHDHGGEEADEATAKEIVTVAREHLSWLRAAIWKIHGSRDTEARNGRMLFGTPKEVDRKVREGDVRYAIELLAHQDASFYVDTRELRAWLRANMAGKRVLNTFAYTGSLGVAARSAPAAHVVHVDRNKAFLTVAKDSYTLNGFEVKRDDFRTADYFEATARLRKDGDLFDCVIVDPPFFATSGKGRVDAAKDFGRLLAKARPLVGNGGALIAVSNALFVPGAEHMRGLEAHCADGYASVEAILPVPPDCTGFAETVQGAPPCDPAPFPHSTKIAVLRVRRKDERSASDTGIKRSRPRSSSAKRSARRVPRPK
jgi:23S rRNA (cytosine1962-C5)-methyltransferase